MATFRFLRAFREADAAAHAGSRARLRPRDAERFPGQGLFERFARELALERAVPIKELCEAGEVFVRARRLLRAPVVADLCAGCGLLGVLFALCERSVETVHLIDREPPPSLQDVLAAALRLGPWVEGKVRVHRALLRDADAILPAGASLVAIHACGERTDAVLDLALARRAPLAVLPCCHASRRNPAPLALRRALGETLSADVDRTYRLARAGFHVRWEEIPSAITPMNRLLLAAPGSPPRTAPPGEPGASEGVARTSELP